MITSDTNVGKKALRSFVSEKAGNDHQFGKT